MALSDAKLRNIQKGQRAQKITDREGLHLLVTTAGGKLWRMQYRYLGKQKTLAFGRYPEVSLADARSKVSAAKSLLASGKDPSFEAKVQKLSRATSASNTFSIVADEYLLKYRREGRAEATLTKTEWLIDFARPLIGSRPIAEIMPVEVLAVLRGVEARGRLDTARRLRSTIGCVFRYAIATARASNDPTFSLRGALAAPQPKSRAAIIDPQKFGALLRVIADFDGQPTTRIALQLMAFLFPRPGELRHAEWSEVDLSSAVWMMPAEKTKMRRAHKVPLPKQALELLRELHTLTGRTSLLFHSIRTVKEPISENTMNAALRRLGYDTSEMTPHGFRATASSLLNESGLWHADAIERQLAHVEGSDVRRAYLRGEHWDERVRMMSWWANHLDELKNARQVQV